MSYANRIWRPYLETTALNQSRGHSGVDPRSQVPLQLSTGGLRFQTEQTVADNYTRVQLWASGDGGVTDWSILWVATSAACLLEFTTALTGVAVIPLGADLPFVLRDNDIAPSALSNGSLTTVEAITGIFVKRNVADAVGDAVVTLELYE